MRRKLWKSAADLVESPRVNAYLSCGGFNLGLGSYPIVLVFYYGISELVESFVCGFGRGGKHEAYWMEEPHACFAERVRRSEANSLGDVASEHIGPFDFVDG